MSQSSEGRFHISIFTAYIAGIVFGRGADSMTVFRMTGAVAVLGYALADIPNSVWRGQPWVCTLKFLVDGVIYGLVTGAVFMWLWPAAG
jgi:hypothetical protein